LAQMRASGRLPIAQLCIACALPRKILERHRKYIIAAAEILTNDYPYLIEYVSYITGGQSK
jgi:RNA polymerase sigma factor